MTRKNQTSAYVDPSLKKYSQSSPPSTVEEATSRMELLNVEIADIDTQLEHVQFEDYPSDRDYYAWRTNATKASGHKKAEVRFLEQWIDRQAYPANQPIIRGGSLNEIAASIRRRVEVLAAEIRPTYTSVYSAKQLPPDFAAAQARMSELTAVKHTLQGAFTEITGEWTQHPLRRDDLSGVKAPLQKILSAVEVELSVVRGYVKANVQNSPIRSDWKAICFHALSRAVSEGFVLTNEESQILEQLRSHVKSLGGKVE